QIWVAGADASEVWSISPSTRALTLTVRVGAQPGSISFSSDGRRAYVANRADNSVSVLDAATGLAIATLHSGTSPAAIGFSTANVRFATPVPAATAAKPTPTPTLVPSPTKLPQGVQPRNLPRDTVVETFLSGAAFPTAIAFAPDGRVFYDELRTGKIRVVKNG